MMTRRMMIGNRCIGLAGVFLLSAVAVSAQVPSLSTARQPAAEAAEQARSATG